MSSLPSTVNDVYRYVVGVDTHAATHSYAIVTAPNGALIDQATFPTTGPGLRRARDWIGRRSEGDLDGVLVAAEGTGSYGALLCDVCEPFQRGRSAAENDSGAEHYLPIGACPEGRVLPWPGDPGHLWWTLRHRLAFLDDDLTSIAVEIPFDAQPIREEIRE